MKKYEKLTQYIGKLNPGKWMPDPQPGDGTDENPYIMPFVDYDEIVMAYYQDVYKVIEELNIDYAAILEKTGMDKVQNLEEYDISGADGEILLCLLLHIIRRDRFCEGYLNRFIQNGMIEKWLKRLNEIDN